MKRTVRKAIIGLAGLAAIPFILGSGISSAQETTSTTTYAAPAPAPVVIQTPAERTNVTEEKATDTTSAVGPNAVEQSSSAYHSEATTVTPPPAPVVVVPDTSTSTTTTIQKTN